MNARGRSDPTAAIRDQAASFPAVVAGTSCNQSAFKTAAGSFLFIGPGAKGQGYKAMFKLDASISQAKELAAAEPDRFEMGRTGWATARFTAERPLPKSIWSKWLAESYELYAGDGKARPTKKKSARRS